MAEYNCFSFIIVNENVMIRIRYNRIPHPAQYTKRERNTDTDDSIKYKTVQVESQEASAFQADCH